MGCRLWIWSRYSLHWWDGLPWIYASTLWPTNWGSTAVGSSWRAVWHCCYWRCRECKKVSRLWWATRSIQESIVQYKSFPKEKKAIDQYMSMLKVSCKFVIIQGCRGVWNSPINCHIKTLITIVFSLCCCHEEWGHRIPIHSFINSP